MAATAPAISQPLVTIEAGKGWGSRGLRDLWAYRELLYFLMWRDVKVRYKQTLLGAGWAIIQPVLTMVIFTFIFGRVARIDSEGIPYPLFAYAGLLPWTFLSNAIIQSSNSLVGSSHLITKVYFPRIMVPIAAVGSALVDLAVAVPILALLMFYYGIFPGVTLIALPLLLILTTLLAIATGTWLSAVNVRYRDIKFVIPFLTQILMYISPIAFPASVIPSRFRLLYSLNPVVGLIENYRATFFNRPLNWLELGMSSVVTVIWLVYSIGQFRKMERSFADII